ncbi:MAG: glutathione S-transferase N-terminal domain-containing protein [Rhodospirillales bacterium]|nr:glutathione S-transferase N-terminal domain-containing protein [Rhodospirillales bacterium]
MTIKLYELAGRNDSRPSPYCWRARLALAHKGLEAEIIPIGFLEKDKLGFSGQALVPVLVDGDTTIADSWHIACYLDAAYPDRPSLLGGDIGMAAARIINAWAEPALIFAVFPMVVMDGYNASNDDEHEYFRTSREGVFGRKLEEVQADQAKMLPAFREGLGPLRAALEARTMVPGDFREAVGRGPDASDTTPFLGGQSPAYIDYIAFSSFQWERIISNFELLDENDILWAWRERMLDLYDGYARKAARAMD